MKAVRIDEDRLEKFAVAYVPAALAATQEIQPWLGGRSAEAYAVEAALSMVEVVRRMGVAGIEHYYFNTRGGALRLTCQALGIEATTEALADYIGGR